MLAREAADRTVGRQDRRQTAFLSHGPRCTCALSLTPTGCVENTVLDTGQAKDIGVRKYLQPCSFKKVLNRQLLCWPDWFAAN